MPHDIEIVWDANSEIDLDHYNIYRSSDGGLTYTKVGESKQPYFKDRSIPENANYAIASLVVGAEDVGEFIITGIDLTSVFQALSTFLVQRTDDNDGTYQVKTVSFSGGDTHIFPFGGVSGTDTDGFILQPYLYYPTAVDKAGNESTPGTTVIKTSPPDIIAPAAPTNVTARRLEDYSGVELFWDQVLDTNLKGFIIYRTFDGLSFHVAGTTSNTNFKDDKIPRGLDTVFGATYVAYSIASYDKTGNISQGSSPTNFFTIPLLRSLKVNIDYLSLNVTWKTPLPEDNVAAVGIFYKKKVDSEWIFAGAVDYPTSRLTIVGPLDKATEYDVLATIFISSTFPITGVNQGLKTFTVAGDQTASLPPGALMNVTGSTGNDDSYTIVSSTYTTSTAIVVAEAIPVPTVDGSLFGFTYQVPVIRAIIPDYEQDTVNPTLPTALNAVRDPANNRIFLSWIREAIDDDFMRYEIEVLESSFYRTLARSTSNSYTLNNALFYMQGDFQIYVRVRAVDRSGNISGTSSLVIKWFSDDLNGISVNDYLPAWMTYTEEDSSQYKLAGMRRYQLEWNDAGRRAEFFEFYMLYVVQEKPGSTKGIVAVNSPGKIFGIAGNFTSIFPIGATIYVRGSTGNDGTYTIAGVAYSAPNTYITVNEAVPSGVADGYLFNLANDTPSSHFTYAADEILMFNNRNSFTLYTSQNVVDAEAIYLQPAVRDLFGDIFIAPVTSILRIIPTV